jgi:hypothetical protein
MATTFPSDARNGSSKMKNLSIATALLISALAGISVTQLATDASPLAALAAPLVLNKSDILRGAGQAAVGPAFANRPAARTRENCRRDARAYPTGGQATGHREAGDDCEVRAWRRSGPALP